MVHRLLPKAHKAAPLSSSRWQKRRTTIISLAHGLGTSTRPDRCAWKTLEAATLETRCPFDTVVTAMQSVDQAAASRLTAATTRYAPDGLEEAQTTIATVMDSNQKISVFGRLAQDDQLFYGSRESSRVCNFLGLAGFGFAEPVAQFGNSTRPVAKRSRHVLQRK